MARYSNMPTGFFDATLGANLRYTNERAGAELPLPWAWAFESKDQQLRSTCACKRHRELPRKMMWFADPLQPTDGLAAGQLLAIDQITSTTQCMETSPENTNGTSDV